MSDPFPDDVDPEDWEEARRRADAIREFVRHRPDRSTVEEILELATVLGVSQATAYRLVRLFRKGGTVSALPLMPRAALLAAVAILERQGPLMLARLEGKMIGQNRSRFRELAATMLGIPPEPTGLSSLQHI